MKDVHGQAILDYYKGEKDCQLTIHTSYGEPEEMSVAVFFRDELDFTTLEHLALIECEGKILDVGAGAGAHALMLQGLDKDVYALESSAGCVEVMKQSGVHQIIYEDYLHHKGQYDTLLLLMNGLGIVGKIENVPAFLKLSKRLIKKGGKMLLDSSDISYLYEEGIQKPSGYYGNIKYQYEYLETKGTWFDWTYVDQKSFMDLVIQEGLLAEILYEDENDQYLCLITGY